MAKQRWEESQKRITEDRRSERRKSQSKEEAGAQKGSKVAKDSKSRLAKAARVAPTCEMRDGNRTLLEREAHFEIKRVND